MQMFENRFFISFGLIFTGLIFLCTTFVDAASSDAVQSCNQAPAIVKTMNENDSVTVFMGREARNITINWGEETNCEFEIFISCGLGVFVPISTEKAKSAGVQTYNFTRVTVEELRIIIRKGKGIIKNIQTLSTKADDTETYNPI